MTAERGSTTGVDGTVVSPAPRRGARLRLIPARRRVGALPLLDRAVPNGAEASRYDAAVEAVTIVRLEPAAADPPLSGTPAEVLVGAFVATLAGATVEAVPTTPAGAAAPHTSQ